MEDRGSLKTYSSWSSGDIFGLEKAGEQAYNLKYEALVSGEGTYEAEYGSQLYIDVIDVTSNEVLGSSPVGTTSVSGRSLTASSENVIADSLTFDLTK